MASAVVEKKQPVEVEGEMCAPTTQVRGGGGKGLRQYYVQYIHDLQLQIRKKANNLQRLEAQRNDLNSRVRMLREELQLLQKPSSYVGEVVKVMGKSKVLVKHWYYIFLRFKKGRLLDLCIATKMENSLHWRKQTSLMEYMFMKSALYDS
ncbi:26S proteasome regulatory subunit 8 homolog A-like isoform X5 [Zingiber officinale]|uniref:26S proteasome regulatory subunit 8 homolog A-like isoform X5 n=1 Tax=Zingiber officinale TaxID=94328 RepID=UPI001C4B3AA8|nr:26S proteasome regulatory subunit 8 homolog A-like isoform X5 [Zingiber officinale]